MPASLSTASAGLLLVAFLWGAVFATGKAAVHDVSAVTVAMLRFGLATLVLLPLYVNDRRGSALLPSGWPAWRALLLLGLTAVFAYNALFFGGLSYAPSSDAILLVPTANPIWTALFAALFLHESISRRLRIGMLVALGGMALVLIGGPSASFGGDRLIGNLMFVASASVFGLSHVISRVAIRYVSPLGATTIAGALGTLMFLPFVVVGEGYTGIAEADLGFWLAVSFIAFLGTALSYILWYRGVQTIGAGNTAFYTNLVPLFGLTLSAVFLDEYPTLLQIAGGIVMLGAVIWVTRRPAVVPPVDAPAITAAEVSR